MEAGSTQGGAAAVGADPFAAMAAQLTPKRAVSYIRVSTREQAQRGGRRRASPCPLSVKRISAKLSRWVRWWLRSSPTAVSRLVVRTGLSCRRCWLILRKMVGLTMSSSTSSTAWPGTEPMMWRLTGRLRRPRPARLHQREHRPDAGGMLLAWHHEQYCSSSTPEPRLMRSSRGWEKRPGTAGRWARHRWVCERTCQG